MKIIIGMLKSLKTKLTAADESKLQFAIVLAAVLVSIIVRLFCFYYESRDYNIFLKPWVDEIELHGGFASLRMAIGDYFPPYIYILTIISYLPINSLYAIKIVSCIGDIVLACYMYKIVNLSTKKSYAATAAFAVTILLPTVILNSSLWGQCDSLYTAALVACVYYMMNKEPNKGMVAFSIAFIFKLQAIFLAPLILLLLIKKWVRIRHLFYAPAIYFLAVLPAWAAGRNLVELLTIYVKQTDSYQALTLNAPNIYTFFNSDDTQNIGKRCLAVVAFVMLLCFIKLWKTKFTLTPRLILQFSMLCAVALPFVLPHMHERYFYLADVLAVAYVFTFKRRWFVPLIVVCSSFLVYGMYLFGFSRWMDAAYAAAPMGYVLYRIAKDFITDMQAKQPGKKLLADSVVI